MALSDEQWQKIADKTGCFITGGLKEAIEAEVRKQDTALIRQLVEALTTLRATGAHEGFAHDIATTAITAGRARLDGKS